MTRRSGESLADYYRRHRRVMELALEMGVTPIEAEAEIERIASRERARAAEQRRRAMHLRLSQPAAICGSDAEPRAAQPWMMRD